MSLVVLIISTSLSNSFLHEEIDPSLVLAISINSFIESVILIIVIISCLLSLDNLIKATIFDDEIMVRAVSIKLAHLLMNDSAFLNGFILL